MVAIRKHGAAAFVTLPKVRRVRDDPASPDPGFAQLYAGLPDATDLEPWLSLARRASPPVLYLGAGAGRLAFPLFKQGVQLVAVDAHPGMVELLRSRLPSVPVHQAMIEKLALEGGYDLVIAPSNILCTPERLSGAARQLRVGGSLAFELTNPHWLEAGAGAGFRLLTMNRRTATAEVDYPNDYRQIAEIPLVWPEDIEDFLSTAGLRLVRIFGQRAGKGMAGLAESPTFFTVSRRPGSGS